MRRAMSTLIYARRERLHPGLLDQMVSGGAEAIEIFGARGHFNYTDRQHIRQIANWFRSTGVTFHSMHSPMHPDEDWGRGGATHINIASVEKLQRIAATDEIKRAIEVAELAPFQFLVQHVGIGHEEADSGSAGPARRTRPRSRRGSAAGDGHAADGPLHGVARLQWPGRSRSDRKSVVEGKS